MAICSLDAYELIKKQRIDVLETDGYILRHKKTGARVVLMQNDDDNKVFYVGFRTPPKESTGVMHILEHSVLCGSKKYPVKDPFIELAKGSLNTFLNAMTFPDKTVYPIASCNDKDFHNLMSIYLDAVFYPNILNSDMAFRQEGWHYELDNAEDDIKINGVVYSEMKGAFSSPDDVLNRLIFNSLYPDTPYSEESGGDPECIPSLTYEHYLEIYREFYHPSNSYIFLYGNVDMEKELAYIDKEYLSNFDKIEVDSEIMLQKAFEEPVYVTHEYAISAEESLDSNTYLSYNCAMKDNLNPIEYLAWQVIEYALCESQGAVLKEALLEKGIGKEVYSHYENGIAQPYYSIVAKGTDSCRKDEFIATIKEVCANVVKNGFDKDTLKAGLNALEFATREADYGSYPAGLIYGLTMLDSWLYDDDLPFIHLDDEESFATLRKAIDTDFYEKLLKEGILENNHISICVVEPNSNLREIRENELKEKLSKYKASLSDAEIEQLITDTKKLREYQETKDTPKELECIPLLTIDDIRKEATPLCNEEEIIGDNTYLYHPINTKGINYIRVLFNCNNVPAEYYKYIGILFSLIGFVDTDNYSYLELSNKIFIETGGLSTAVNVFENRDTGVIIPTFDIKGKCFKGDIEKVFKYLDEIVNHSKYVDKKRIRDVFREAISRTEAAMLSSGHAVASNEALSSFSQAQKLARVLKGNELYRFVVELENDFDKRYDELCEALNKTAKYLFAKSNVMFDFAGTRQEYASFKKCATEFATKLSSDYKCEDVFGVQCEKKNVGYTCASSVQYVCRAGNYKKAGLKYTGALRVLKVILGYDYLWNNIRVKGGAYGCMSAFSTNGDCYFVSYRDPHLNNTINVFEGTAAYLSEYNVSKRQMTQSIIGAISTLDTPVTPFNRALKSLRAYMCGEDDAFFQRERDELLATDVETIRDLSKYVKAVIDENNLCVVGGEEKINSNKAIFDEIKSLIETDGNE